MNAAVVVGAAIATLVALMIVGVMAGSVAVDVGTTVRILGHRIFGPRVVTPDWTRAQDLIIADTRLPRVLLAAVVGAALSLVGTMIQAVVRNPLAGPGILGVSAGASTGAVVALRYGSVEGWGPAVLPLAAFTGALLAIVTVVGVSRGAGAMDPVRLVLSGVAISAVLSAVTSLLVLTAPDPSLAGQVLQWTLGGFGGARWGTLVIPVAALAVGVILVTPLARNLNVLLTGDESATALGVNVPRLRVILVILSAILTGVMVAVSGVIGFLGLMVPHMSRLLVGGDHRRVLPVALLIGASFAVGTDMVARTAAPPVEIPVGIVTALVGGPYFVWLLRRTGRWS
ncbi:FecCD family ABC transporter permease [Dietzia sp. 179-F 9C3 NHS]|uniref:FecCD family ABC transporter permease n=1 Tax=Dietzia sp. 179-F 9C3 NHS TaxID=3374295 RepID=UPI00387936C9